MWSFSPITRFFNAAIKSVRKAFSPEHLSVAMILVKHAASSFVDNPSRRTYVVEALMRRFGVPESTARLLTELAVHAVKAELEK